MEKMPFKYNALLDVFNKKENLTWDKTLSFLVAKETELLDMSILKKESAHYAGRDDCGFFWELGSHQDTPGGRPGSKLGGGPKGWPSAQLRIQFLQVSVKCYVCEKAHMLKDCLMWLAINDSRK